MSDDILDPEDDDSPLVSIKRSQIRALEQKARRADEEATARAAAERKLAFAEAGIPLSDTKLSYFVKGYDGDLTPEAIRTAAVSAGFISSEEPEPTVPVAEQEAHARLSGTAAGSEPPKTTLSLDDLQRADSPEKVMAMVQEMGIAATRE